MPWEGGVELDANTRKPKTEEAMRKKAGAFMEHVLDREVFCAALRSILLKVLEMEFKKLRGDAVESYGNMKLIEFCRQAEQAAVLDIVVPGFEAKGKTPPPWLALVQRDLVPFLSRADLQLLKGRVS